MAAVEHVVATSVTEACQHRTKKSGADARDDARGAGGSAGEDEIDGSVVLEGFIRFDASDSIF